MIPPLLQNLKWRHGAGFSPSKRFRWVLPVLGFAVWASCIDSVSGPASVERGVVGFQPVLPAGLSATQFGLYIDSIGVEVRRQDSPDVLIADTTIFFPPDSDEVELALELPLRGKSDDFTVALKLGNGPFGLFAGTEPVTVHSGSSGSSVVDILVDYVGPGENIVRLEFAPGDTVVTLGDQASYAVRAFDVDGNSVEKFYVSWSTSSPAVRINAAGILEAPDDGRSSAFVRAITPNSVSDSVRVVFAPEPNSLSLSEPESSVFGVGDSVQLTVTVDAADGLGVPGVPVQFTTDFESTIDTILLTDSLGIASIRAAVGTVVGERSFVAQCVETFSRCQSLNLLDTLSVTALAGAPKAIENVAGFDHVFGEVGSVVAETLAVRVLDNYGNPVPRATVVWMSVNGAGLFFPDTSVTDDLGVARSQWTLGTVAGMHSVSAALGTGLAVAYTATAVPGPAIDVVEVGGGGQSATAGDTLALPLEILVVDRYQNPVGGTQVEFVAPPGGSVTTSLAVTDDNGRAATRAVLGTAAGTQLFYAVGPNGSNVTFDVSARADVAADVVIESGESQVGIVGESLNLPLVVKVRDAYGNPVPGHLVNFVVTGGAGSMWAGSVNTDSGGVAADFWTLGTSSAVEHSVEARAVEPDGFGGFSKIVFAQFTATAVPDIPAAVEKISGDSQSGVVGELLGNTLSVRVVDRFSNPVPAGTQVDWATDFGSVTPTVSFTDNMGAVTTQWTLGTNAGEQVAVASVAEIVSPMFSANALPGPVAFLYPTVDALSFVALGETAVLGMTATDQFGNSLNLTVLDWNVDDIIIAEVSSQGVVTALAPGQTTVVATANGVASSPVVIDVSQVIASITVLPGANELAALGNTVRLRAEARDALGSLVPVPSFVWRSLDGAVLMVENGLVTAVGNGTATVTASSGGMTGSAAVTVSQAVTGIVLTPPTATLTSIGATTVLSAVAVDANGNAVSGATFDWTTSDSSVATVSVDGTVTAIGNGSATITVTSGSASASSSVTVSIPVEPPPATSVASVSISPATSTITVIGAVEQLSAVAYDDGGGEIADVVFEWASSNAEVATVDALGVVTAVGNGIVSISATVGDVTGTAEVTVIGTTALGDTVVVMIDVMPGASVSSINLSSKGNTPVAILTSNVDDGDPLTFDATQVDVESVRFGGLSPLRSSTQDVDGDGDLDLLIRFQTDNLDLPLGLILATLTGQTLDGTPFKGVDAVTVQP